MTFEEFKRKYQNAPVEEYPNTVCENIPVPIVSVRVSTYQHADFIRDCLDGILMQETTFPVEIAIGEDESSDGTREICMEYADKHPDQIRLFLHSRQNNIRIDGQPTGKFQATYTSFMCRGRYIALCEGDDYWTDPHKLQKQVDFLEENEAYVLTYHPFVEKSEGVPPWDSNDVITKVRSDGNIKKWPQTLTLVYRNIIYDYPSQFMEVIAGDAFLEALLRLHGKFSYIEDINPAVYRCHGEGIWSSKSRMDQALISVRAYLKIHEAILDTKSEQEVEKKIAKWFIDLVNASLEKGTTRKDLLKITNLFMVLCGKGLVYKVFSHPRLRYIMRVRLGEVKRRIISKLST